MSKAQQSDLFLSTPSARRATSSNRKSTAQCRNFYPRPPRGGRPIVAEREKARKAFLSTPSARRATSCPPSRTSWFSHFYPRPPRGGRHQLHALSTEVVVISIHALREEGDPLEGGRPVAVSISIHALREEGDFFNPDFPSRHRHFYPRPPRGGRPQKRRKTSPLLFHYKTICTDLEELVQKHPKKQLRSAQNGLKTWCEGDGKGVSAFHSH